MQPLRTLTHKTRYCTEWQHSSENLRSQGCYKWMAQQLDKLAPRRILDIGCGTGNGLLALIDHFHPETLISLEENINCIETASKSLIDDGQHPQAHIRLQYLVDPSNKKYRVLCSDTTIEIEPGLSIIQADITRDDVMLLECLDKAAPFDVITVWLIGTDGHNLHSVDTNSPNYRRHIQRRLCELADRFLRPGGWIQFVDRTIFPLNENQKKDLVEEHKSLIESTRLEFLEFSNIPYQEAKDGGIPLVKASGKIEPDERMGLASLISCLPERPFAVNRQKEYVNSERGG